MPKSKRVEKKQDYREVLQHFVTNPAVKYVAGGIASAVLHRFTKNLSMRYPEINRVLKENLDFIESRLAEYSANFEKDHISDQMKMSH